MYATCMIVAEDLYYVSAVAKRLSAFIDSVWVDAVFDVPLTCVWMSIVGCIVGQGYGRECLGRE